LCEDDYTGCTASAACDGNSANTCSNGAPPDGYCSTCTYQASESTANACRCDVCGTDNSAPPGSCAVPLDPWDAGTWPGDIAQKCCEDDAGEYIITNAGGTDCTWCNPGCCDAATDCVDGADNCQPLGGFSGAAWLCVAAGNWQNCAAGSCGESWTPVSTTYYCTYQGSYAWRTSKTADGSQCGCDSECNSGYCDNDGVGLADDGWCYTPDDDYGHCAGGNCMDNQDDTCEYDTGAAARHTWAARPTVPATSIHGPRAGSMTWIIVQVHVAATHGQQ
jgi:hypothetical protein